LQRNHEQADGEQRVERSIGSAADRGPDQDEEGGDAGEEGDGGPAIGAGEGRQRPADQEK
jgi:hypothetical protein